MKQFILIFSLLFSITSFSQLLGPNESGSKDCPCCKSKKDRESDPKLNNRRFGIWECGRSDKIIDCSEKLDYDENTNTVIHKLTGKPFTGDCETCHFNGIRERLLHFVNGKEEGTDTSYYFSGCPMAIRNMSDGVENGESTYFYDSLGTEAWRQNYSFGVKHGQQIYYDKDHKPKKIEHYYDGALNGNKKVFFPGSYNVKTDVNYQMDLLQGTYKTYVENDTGAVMVINYVYNKGVKDGQQETFYNSGEIMTTEEFKKGVKHGPSTTFYVDGSVMKSETFTKGLQHGEFKHYKHDGKVQWEAEYKKGKLLSEIYYDEFGNPIQPDKKEGTGEEGEGFNDDIVDPDKKKKKKRKKRSKKEDKEED
jgi:antitoxin component YwqK of YwqJK toxin-antitoxin module